MTRKRIEDECGTCGEHGVCWQLVSCPDCKVGKEAKKMGDKLEKKYKQI